jgi:S-adenosylmethionine:tRNA ribosyltransferase-isomerase
MLTELFDYELPPERIAQRPTKERDESRLLCVRGRNVEHRWIDEWPELVPDGALVVLNDTRVIKARLLCRRSESGGKAEFLLLNRIGSQGSTSEHWLALGQANRAIRDGAKFRVGPAEITVLEKVDERFLRIALDTPDGVAALLEAHGHVPLPPYVKRSDDTEDETRYQTVFARHDGSVAAPTAGLHLSQRMLERLRERRVEVATVTLHVGAGTFLPVSASDLNQHLMHRESFDVSAELARSVEAVRSRGGSVVAVGTTVVRALESARIPGERCVTPQMGETSLLIQPGYHFEVVDSLLTNFHAPRTTLMALVAAFIGLDETLNAYRQALENGYRFLSYGDAMWLPEPKRSSLPGEAS